MNCSNCIYYRKTKPVPDEFKCISACYFAAMKGPFCMKKKEHISKIRETNTNCKKYTTKSERILYIILFFLVVFLIYYYLN